MCESKAVLLEGNARKIIMSDVAQVTIDDTHIRCRNIIGEEVEVKHARISKIDFIKHQMFIKPEE